MNFECLEFQVHIWNNCASVHAFSGIFWKHLKFKWPMNFYDSQLKQLFSSCKWLLLCTAVRDKVSIRYRMFFRRGSINPLWNTYYANGVQRLESSHIKIFFHRICVCYCTWTVLTDVNAITNYLLITANYISNLIISTHTLVLCLQRTFSTRLYDKLLSWVPIKNCDIQII